MWRRGDTTETDRMPEWGIGHGARRVLVECADPSEGWASRRILERAGYEVAVCPGPEALRDGCPLLTDGRCTLAEEAHAVMSELALSHATTRQVLKALRARHPDTPVIIEVTREDRLRYPEIVDRRIALDVPVYGREMAGAVEGALGRTA